MIRLNPEEISFPDPERYHPKEGVIAIGGDLSPERLLFAYENGIFPWYNPGDEILWWSPDPRFVLFPKEIVVSKSMQKILNKKIFTFTENTCFSTIMQECMQNKRKEQEGSWINNELIKSFTILHNSGFAKSIEVWQNKQLVGGLYGMQIGNIFCGESMFTKVSNASKAGFIQFVLKNQNLSLIDCQSYTKHLESLGARMIPKKQFLQTLKNQKP